MMFWVVGVSLSFSSARTIVTNQSNEHKLERSTRCLPKVSHTESAVTAQVGFVLSYTTLLLPKQALSHTNNQHSYTCLFAPISSTCHLCAWFFILCAFDDEIQNQSPTTGYQLSPDLPKSLRTWIKFV
mmetsp:Transcript_7409/g.27689  ORF Transcript_7409/g.27689 Transcript_7409/m.27689 type:complete len:128 (-) Transcript_7409:886-1269(-)